MLFLGLPEQSLTCINLEDTFGERKWLPVLALCFSRGQYHQKISKVWAL